MDPYFGEGIWSMIASVPTHSNASTPSNQDLYLQQQQQLHQQQQQQQLLLTQQQQQLLLIQQQQTQHNLSLASQFPLLHLVENLADAIDNETRDQHVDALINELNNHFEKWQQLLNSVAGSISTQSMTVEEHKRELEESEKMLNQRRDLIDNYPSSVEDLIKSEL